MSIYQDNLYLFPAIHEHSYQLLWVQRKPSKSRSAQETLKKIDGLIAKHFTRSPSPSSSIQKIRKKEEDLVSLSRAVDKIEIDYQTKDEDYLAKKKKRIEESSNFFTRLIRRAIYSICSSIARKRREWIEQECYLLRNRLSIYLERERKFLVSVAPVTPAAPLAALASRNRGGGLIQSIMNYLNPNEIASLSKVDAIFQRSANPALLARAQQWGYVASPDAAESAKQYLDSLFREVNQLCDQSVFPPQCIPPADRQFDSEADKAQWILEQLRGFTPDDWFNLFSKECFSSETAVKRAYFISAVRHIAPPQQIASLERRAGAGTLALHWAVRSQNLPLCTFLLQQGADANTPPPLDSFVYHNNPPLHYAAQMGQVDMVEVLIHHGATVNIQTRVGLATPLTFACGYGDHEYFKPNIKLVELLLRHQANPNLPTFEGKLPREYALNNRLNEIADLLTNENR